MTVIQKGSGLAPMQYSEALVAMVGLEPTPMNSLSGPAPTIDKAAKVLRRQTTTGMPIMRVTDLSKSAGDTVRIDYAQIAKLVAIMGDTNAEGQGADLNYSFADASLNLATLPVKLGGKMTQKRFQHEHYQVGLAQLKGGIPSFEWQRMLVAMAGARGTSDGVDWVLPLQSHSTFAAQMVNPVLAPSYNRHFVVNGTGLTQGGLQTASIATTDILKLSHIDELAGITRQFRTRLGKVMIPGDRAAMDSPIRGLLLLDELVFQQVLKDTTSGNNLRTWQVNALERAKYGQIGAHPLFSPGSFLWNDFLVRSMGDFGIRFLAGDSYQYVAVADRLAGTETTGTIPALGGAGAFQVCRSLLLGAQAAAHVMGVNSESELPYTMLENWENFGRNREIAGELMSAPWKTRFQVPDGSGNMEQTDIGIVAIDSVVPRFAA